MSRIRMRHVTLAALVFSAAAFVACEKKDGVTAETTPSASPSPAAKPSAEAKAEAKADAAAESVATALASAEASAKVDAPARTNVAASASAKPSASASAKAAASAAPAEPIAPSRTRIDGKNFTLDVASPGCRVDTDCTVTIRLSANGEYHVNKEYPYKFLAQAAPQLTYLGKDDPNTFSRAAGDFREEGEKAATMTVRFRPKSAGDTKVSGTYKMSVCSAENCQIEMPRVELAVAVK